MKKKARARARCAMCGKKPAYVIDESHFCEPCLRELVFMHAPEPSEVVEAIEKVARIGALHPRAGILALMRAVDSGQQIVEAMTKAVEAFVPSDVAEARPDAFVANDLLNGAEEHSYGINSWWIGLDPPAAAHAVVASGASSVRELFETAQRDETVRTLLDDSIRFPILGEAVSYGDVVGGELGERLAAVLAEDFALGFARVAELGEAVQMGSPVAEPYGAEERELFFTLNHERIRRAAAAWMDANAFLESLTKRVDRREHLAAIWLLHPVSGPLAEYLTILHGLHVDGHHAAAVAFCRSLVESGVNRTTDPAFLAQRPTMEDRLNVLERRGVLSKEGRRNAKDVWWRGNKVLHSDPSLLTDSLATIQLAIQVLSELSPHLPKAPLDPEAAAFLAELDAELS